MILLGGLEAVVHLVTVTLIFIFVLALAVFTTRWLGNYQKGQMFNKNIKVIETFKLSPNKYVQIIQIGTRYVAIAISKDTVTKLVELTEEEILEFPDEQSSFSAFGDKYGLSKESFQEIFSKMKDQVKDKMKK